jgi:hypothetical protein
LPHPATAQRAGATADPLFRPPRRGATPGASP